MGYKAYALILAILVGWVAYELNQTPPFPQLKPNPWWGPGKSAKGSTEVTPFKIAIPEKDLEDLRARLSRPLRLTHGLENANFTYGINPETLKTIVDFWKNKYNWREREKLLNAFPQFKTQIEGLDIHFLRIKPKPAKSKTIKPLLLIHGWPGSFVEFDEIIPLLSSPHPDSDVVFEVVCPSLPGYGFSESSSKPGLGAIETSQIFLKLMQRLGFESFYVQGGDWGALVASVMATIYPDKVIGMHINMMTVNTPMTQLKFFLGSYLPSGTFFSPLDNDKYYPLSSFFSLLLRESGYMHIQATKPDTIGVALGDSPVGLAAYLLEKFSTWTNLVNVNRVSGGLLSNDFPISLDRLLDNVCIYWFSGSITTSMRYYAESIPRIFSSKIDGIPTDVPSGFSSFKHEILSHPENFLSHKYKNIVSYVRHDQGGHFAAMEQPSVLAKDVHSFVNAVEKQLRLQSKTKSEL